MIKRVNFMFIVLYFGTIKKNVVGEGDSLGHFRVFHFIALYNKNGFVQYFHV